MKRSLTTLVFCLTSLSASAQSNWTPVRATDLSQHVLLLTEPHRIDANKGAAIAPDLIQQADEACCPSGYPWYRQSANTCWTSYGDCHDGNGGGWYCRQVNAC
jgi:hypothetical protein